VLVRNRVSNLGFLLLAEWIGFYRLLANQLSQLDDSMACVTSFQYFTGTPECDTSYCFANAERRQLLTSTKFGTKFRPVKYQEATCSPSQTLSPFRT
jgi:hypothetical protein